jgi:hypothetical protein
LGILCVDFPQFIALVLWRAGRTIGEPGVGSRGLDGTNTFRGSVWRRVMGGGVLHGRIKGDRAQEKGFSEQGV